MSTPDVTVTISGLTPDPAPGSPPFGDFILVPLKQGLGYQFNVKTTSYPPGTYTLSFTAGADPTTHTLTVTVR